MRREVSKHGPRCVYVCDFGLTPQLVDDALALLRQGLLTQNMRTHNEVKPAAQHGPLRECVDVSPLCASEH